MEKYKVGDKYIEKCKQIVENEKHERFVIRGYEKHWTIIAVFERYILCENGEERKVFQI